MSTWVEERFPDIVVGIDFGMTCTGCVAYTIGPEWGPPKTIQRWPGKLLSELANKVPTSLVYRPDGKTPAEWGFGCDTEDNTSEIKEFFKLHLAPQSASESESTGTSITRKEARRWFQDYISCIYKHVVTHFHGSIPGFEKMRVEFIFSVPTTWKDVRLIEDIRRLIAEAIKAGAPNHWACIGLTEAEAAAVYACHRRYDPGLRLGWRDYGEIAPMDSLIVERLSKVRDELEHTPEHVAWKMLSGRFQRLKCAFGTDVARTPMLSLEVPFLKNSRTDLPVAGIYDGQMSIEWEHIQRSFDKKINEMCELLDRQIQNMETKYPQDRISYLILSGGFGSSPYVRDRLHQRYAVPGVAKHPNVLGLQVLMAEEPQLAVVHGLLLDRIQQLKRGVVMFGSRRSPVSYGIICDLIYDPEKHIGEPVRRDPRDNNLYAIDQIEWLIIQGHTVPHTGISKDFQLKIKPGEEHLPWKVHVVMSTNPPDLLPQSMKGKGAQHVCSLDISTDDVDRKMKNRRWYNMRPRYWRALFEVRVVVGAADLTFQLWSKDQRIRSSQHEPIRVQWMPAAANE
ncbi:hypothetical protein AN3519.2 [Aspergillus nidulans FGSC A4]|uniref:Uncharacterized protein n=1 Tax=Emericella nidulans (strain FGSC A4 / ATCC 38163 / CBS 112.46 / NRRL 194 / M139) TaxID=227321 RepID=Q5B7G1_EMENI|nr:hypothetical protein [Aspergillus nidulans FGSC A4]EAA59080.1 hypothetical protein AN3519.2 [Aspergillus nidulans FGSC A4]CBF75984.1 TPA: conserved hypothetical protein [Aspergillus nidulans FGSC A4]|eukprot:XP_661123.1 hypothetical protein AN3519.2 [Aspergillus nidulans FGSC A4]